MMEIDNLEKEAKEKAARHVANMLHAPDKLEKVVQIKWNVSRKKASVEAMLKTAMQSQLDGVKTGLSQLQKALGDMEEIKTSMKDIDDGLTEIPTLLEHLRHVRDETQRYSQLHTAKENLRHIFTVPETVRQTEDWITEGKLLEAHKALVDLENSRDDLLFELHKLPNQSPADKKVLKEYFAPVSDLSDSMEKQIKFVLRRTLNTVRKDPKIIVTALRIIEREEKSDQECLQRQKSTGFLPPGRPKKWKEKGLSVLKNNVAERIEGNQLENRAENKMWLVRHLELIRLITLEDLRIVKSCCQPVFPPNYSILEHFLDLYHKALSTRILELIEAGLEGQEYVSLLSWMLQTYPGKELMSNANLNISSDKIKPLLENDTIEKLQAQYLKNMKDNYNEWMRNTLAQEVEDWKREEDPEQDNDQCFHTSAPIIIYQMIDENLQVAQTISSDLVNKVLILSMGEIARYGKMYQNGIFEYKTKYFKDRTIISRFTRYMIAIVNNCDRFEELAQELKSRWWKPRYHDNEAAQKFEYLIKTFQSLRAEAIGYLLDESFLDINVHFGDILTHKWLVSTDPIDTVCATLEDYFEDYSYLKPRNFERVISEARDRVASAYITSMLQPGLILAGRRKITFGTDGQERRFAAEKVHNEATQIKRFFHRVAGDMADFDSPFDALALLAEVLKSDEELLSLILGTLVKRYPDLNHEHLLCLLILRGDLSKNDARETALQFVPEDKTKTNATLHAKSIFSRVNVNASVFPNVNKESLNPFANKD